MLRTEGGYGLQRYAPQARRHGARLERTSAPARDHDLLERMPIGPACALCAQRGGGRERSQQHARGSHREVRLCTGRERIMSHQAKFSERRLAVFPLPRPGAPDSFRLPHAVAVGHESRRRGGRVCAGGPRAGARWRRSTRRRAIGGLGARRRLRVPVDAIVGTSMGASTSRDTPPGPRLRSWPSSCARWTGIRPGQDGRGPRARTCLHGSKWTRTSRYGGSSCVRDGQLFLPQGRNPGPAARSCAAGKDDQQFAGSRFRRVSHSVPRDRHGPRYRRSRGDGRGRPRAGHPGESRRPQRVRACGKRRTLAGRRRPRGQSPHARSDAADGCRRHHRCQRRVSAVLEGQTRCRTRHLRTGPDDPGPEGDPAPGRGAG